MLCFRCVLLGSPNGSWCDVLLPSGCVAAQACSSSVSFMQSRRREALRQCRLRATECPGRTHSWSSVEQALASSTRWWQPQADSLSPEAPGELLWVGPRNEEPLCLLPPASLQSPRAWQGTPAGCQVGWTQGTATSTPLRQPPGTSCSVRLAAALQDVGREVQSGHELLAEIPG